MRVEEEESAMRRRKLRGSSAVTRHQRINSDMRSRASRSGIDIAWVGRFPGCVKRNLLLLVLLLLFWFVFAYFNFSFVGTFRDGSWLHYQEVHLTATNKATEEFHLNHQRRGVPRFHIYNPDDFDIYSKCDKHFLEGQFGMGKLFYEELFKMNINYPPEEAEIFIVPALMVESTIGFCTGTTGPWQGYNEMLFREQLGDLASRLKMSKWFQRHNGSDHLLISGMFGVRQRKDYDL